MEAKKMKNEMQLRTWFIKMCAFLVVCSIMIATSEPAQKSVRAASAPVEQVCELEDLRTKTSETYLLSDGTRECVVYAENKYYEDAQGKLERIDNSIIETKYSFNKKEYHYQNAANETAVYFAEDEPAVLAVYGANALAYNLVGGNETSAAAGGSKKFSRVGEYSLYGDNYIAYHGIAEQTDLVFAVHNSGVKEYIVLGNAEAPSEFVFRFEHAGYSIKKVEYGRLGFFDEKGEMVFSLGSLYAVDAAGKYTDQVVYDLKEYDDTSAVIAIKLSESYRQDPERVYPILIDPSVAMTGADQTYDTFVSSKFPNTNYFEDNHLRTGYDDDLYVRRTYIRFIMPSYLYSTAYDFTDARIKIRQYIGTTPEAKAYRVTGSWTSGSLTWNNKPGYTATECSALATLDNDNWYNFVITTIIKKQLYGTYGDYGVMLMDNTESGTQHWSTFYSSEAASPNKPELHITYSSATPITIDRMYSTYNATNIYPSSWIDTRANCYAYALQVYANEKVYYNDINMYAYRQKPGEFSQPMSSLSGDYFLAWLTKTDEQMLTFIADKIKADFNALSSIYGNEWQIQDTTQTAAVPPGWRKVALTLANNSSLHDYHFYLRHSDETWSHKEGVLSVTNESKDSHVIITDSNIAITITEGGYSQGVRYFLIRKPPIMDYLHHSWENDVNNPSQAEFWDCAGDNFTSSKTISGTVSNARMDYAGDVDYYAFTPYSTGTYTITMTKHTYSSGAVDYDMDIYDTYGNTVATDHSGNNPVITIYMQANHRYFIKVYDYNNLITDYKLLITH